MEMELKTYAPVGPKLVFEKIKFNALHYIQHDFIGHHQRFSKYQTRTFKSFTINYFDRRLSNTFKNTLAKVTLKIR